MPENGARRAHDTARWVKEAGLSEGFAACGIAECGPSSHGHHLREWLSRGAHASMAWMARNADVRSDLRRKWDWARTALVGAVSYLSEPLVRQEAPGLVRHVARYARGPDYHDVLKKRLAAWGDAVERRVGPFRRVPIVDTSAILEREMAERAGLGWFGKNTCLIGAEGDSWRFIGLLLTDLELPGTEERLTERCGTCTACMDACPTGAIPEPWFVDARLCISYWTIEHRGEIPDELAPRFGDWAFGCDVCQEVCPWNRRAAPAADPELAAGEALEGISLAELAAMDDATFRARFRGTPLARPKRAGMVRNALIAGANVGDRDVLRVAESLRDDPDPVVAATARRVTGDE